MTFVVTRRDMGERKTANSLRISGLLWCHQESNRGHKDFQNSANRYNCLLIRVVVIEIFFVVLLLDVIAWWLFQFLFQLLYSGTEVLIGFF